MDENFIKRLNKLAYGHEDGKEAGEKAINIARSSFIKEIMKISGGPNIEDIYNPTNELNNGHTIGQGVIGQGVIGQGIIIKPINAREATRAATLNRINNNTTGQGVIGQGVTGQEVIIKPINAREATRAATLKRMNNNII